jgi:hypothetical protein
MIRLIIILLCAILAGCSGGHTTRKREIGYKGKARLNAYLAAGRFLEKNDHFVISKSGWPELDEDVAMLIIPASVISSKAYAEELRDWVSAGGHLLCLVEQAESYRDDWGHSIRASRGGDAVTQALTDFFKDAGLELEHGEKIEAQKLQVDDAHYEVFAESSAGVKLNGGERSTMGQANYGDGLITVMTDARPFRNRYISDHDHAALLLALVDASPHLGSIAIVQDASLSLWSLLWRHGWPALIGLLAMTIFWLWKNMPRFGPMRREQEPTNLRDYDHHLEALGDFQWRLDKGASLLRPLRDSVLERAQRQAEHHHGDLFEWIAQRAEITRDRAQRAMTHERPADATTFTRVLADLQKIHLSLT